MQDHQSQHDNCFLMCNPFYGRLPAVRNYGLGSAAAPDIWSPTRRTNDLRSARFPERYHWPPGVAYLRRCSERGLERVETHRTKTSAGFFNLFESRLGGWRWVVTRGEQLPTRCPNNPRGWHIRVHVLCLLSKPATAV